MSKISCDVTKDLLASYLDGICSEESKGLVEEHLKECAACRQFVEQIQEQDLGKDAEKVDFLKKVKRSMNIRAWMVVVLALLLVFIGHPNIQYQPLDTHLFYIAMPVLMLAGALALKGKDSQFQTVGKGWVIPALGAVLICAALAVQAVSCGMICGKIPIPFPMHDLGPFFDWVNTGIVALSVALLVVSVFWLKGRKDLCIVSLNIAWLGMNLALACDTLLYHMDEPSLVMRNFTNVILILLSEFVVVTALVLVFFRRKDKRQGKNTMER